MKKILSFLLILTMVFSMSMVPASASTTLSGLTIVIDPGHGGYDTGATGYLDNFTETMTVYEKDLTLTYALELKAELESRGATVVMTRDDDTYIGVNDRYRMATNAGADAFISIHFDWIQAPDGTLSMYGQTRTQDKTFSTTLHNKVIYYTGLNNRGVLDCSHSAVGFLGVLNYGGDYPRTLIEVNNLDYTSVQGYELLMEAANFSLGVAEGLEAYFN